MAIDDKPSDVADDLEPMSREMVDLLEVAEMLQDRCDRWITMREILWAIAFAVIIVSEFAIMQLEIAIIHLQFWYLCLLPVPFYLLLLKFWFRYKMLEKRDVRAMNSIINTLRELFTSFASERNVSPLQLAGFRIRLTRFGIGKGYQNDANAQPSAAYAEAKALIDISAKMRNSRTQ